MILRCNDCFITGVKSNNKNALEKARKKIAHFEAEGFIPAGRTDVHPIKIVIPFDWSYGPEGDPNWRMQCHAWRMLDPYFISFEISKKKYYLESIFRYISDWWHWLQFRSSKTGRAWYDMSVGLRACKLALLYQWARGSNLPLKNVAILKNISLAHIDNLLDKENINKANHGIFQAHGLRCLAKAGVASSPLSAVASNVSSQYLLDIFTSQFDEQGIHLEGSFEYQSFAIDKFEQIRASSVWANDLPDGLDSALRKAKACEYWMVYPDGYQVSVGDSSGKAVGLRNSEPDISEAKLWRAKEGYNVFKHIEEPDRSSYLLFISKVAKRVHGHDDFNSLVLWEQGASVLIDPGKYAYVKDRLRKYFLSWQAHNTARVMGCSYSQDDLIIRSTEFDQIDQYIYGRCTFDALARGAVVRQSRSFLYVPRNILFVIDEYDSEIDTELVVLWHLEDSVDVILTSDRRVWSDSAVEVAFYEDNTLTEKDPLLVRYDLNNLKGLSSVRCNYKDVKPCTTLEVNCKGSRKRLYSVFYLDPTWRDPSILLDMSERLKKM